MTTVPAGVLWCALALAACGPLGRLGEGRLEATWTGSDRGRLSARATAIRCPEAHIVQLTGMSGDTGVALLVHPADSLAPGRYPIVEPGSARTTAPAAALGLRLLGTNAVVGYQGASGAVVIERVAAGRLSGRFESIAKVAVALAGTVKLTGRFQDVPLAAGGSACPP
jgi:hypothetical protein